jgi:hypothetical protein
MPNIGAKSQKPLGVRVLTGETTSFSTNFSTELLKSFVDARHLTEVPTLVF